MTPEEQVPLLTRCPPKIQRDWPSWAGAGRGMTGTNEDQPDLQLVVLCQGVRDLAEDGKEHLNQGSPVKAASCLRRSKVACVK